MSFENLVTTYGYPALFLGIVLEGEAFLILGAYLAHRGYFSMVGVLSVAATATILVSQVYFYLGRRYGAALLNKRPQWRSRIEKIQAWLSRYGDRLVLSFRLIWGFRIVIPVTVGTSTYPRNKFLLFNTLGGIAWALLIGLAGNSIGLFVEHAYAHLRHHERWVVLALAGVAAAYGAIRLYRQRALVRKPNSR